VKGALAKPLDGLNNRVVLRSDGTPVFHLANVVDDHEMGITHIVRGDDHVANTYWHILLFEALGWRPPAYGHLPMIVNDQGRPLSKRDGDVYVGEYRRRGILPEALFNYLALLGWSPGEDREMVPREEMVRLFTLERVISTAARFDMDKMLWLNGRYLAARPAEELVDLALPFLEEAGLDPSGRDRPWTARVVDLEKERIRTLAELPGAAAFFFAEAVVPQEEDKRVRKILADPALPKFLEGMGELLAGIEPFTAPVLESKLREHGEATGVGMGKVSQPIRVAVTGGVVSPPIGETLELLGREAVLRRMEALRARLVGPGGAE
jgi:glutamyl-tRNA synthetase